MAAGDGVSRSLQETPTWALATVCFVFIFISVFIEHLIHLLANWLRRHRKTALLEAVEKLKSVLMLLGFMSLILAVTQKTISKICVPNDVAYTMLPCRKVAETKTTKALGHQNHRHWLSTETSYSQGRRLAAESSTESSEYCSSKDMTSIISPEGMNQLSIFIFALAVMQIVYSVLIMALGRAKMRRWKAWEEETQTIEYQAANDPNRFRYTRQTTFGRRHMANCTETSLLLWTKCFFRQFFHSVAKVDYLTLRHSFIAAHLSTDNKTFNFQKYIQRSLEDDFKVVVGISPVMWFLVVIFILLDVHGWNVFLWVSFLPLIIVLVLGTKLEVIVARMALQLKDKNSTIKGTPLVQPNDNLFWFSHPRFVLTLLHFTLFTNAFELAFFVWVTLTFGLSSCYHEKTEIIVIRVVLAVTVQVLCSYITLPLYALVTQMGTNFKRAVLEEHTANVIKQWHATVKQKRKKQKDYSESVQDYSTTSWESSRAISPHHRHHPSSHPPSPTSSFTTTHEISETHNHPHEFVLLDHEHTPSSDHDHDHKVFSSAAVLQIEIPNNIHLTPT